MYTKEFFHNPQGQSFHYLSYLPKERKEEKMPLLILMHGYGETGSPDGSEVDKAGRWGYFAEMKEGKDFPLMMVAPQCPTGHYWISYLESLNEFLDYLIQTYPIDENRIYLTGLSMGGTATWMWAEGNPERFAAIAPVCGEGVEWYGFILKNLPVWAFHGDIDPVVSPHRSLSMVSQINKNGGDAQLTVFPKVQHDAWNYAFNDELISWLLSHRKKEN